MKLIQITAILISIASFFIFLFGLNKLIKKSHRETIEFPNLQSVSREFALNKPGNYMVLITGKRWSKFPLFTIIVTDSDGKNCVVKSNVQAKEQTLKNMTIDLFHFKAPSTGKYSIQVTSGEFSFYHNKLNSTPKYNPDDYKLLIRESYGFSHVLYIIAVILGFILMIFGILFSIKPEILERLLY
ncbi:hypothetical protein [Flavobacterium sp. '19STA2R22 D10 B1']|uniref:hypothetical protein n=1 Tax=Flavobacterium aerium TaxID=3037261 RepID=UPI00278C25B9|nr:hypothetical protein [Flavobacterium sp. '19STA2R22 D10 B1']